MSPDRSLAAKLVVWTCLCICFDLLAGGSVTAEPDSSTSRADATPLAVIGDEFLYVEDLEGALAFRLYQLELDRHALLRAEAERRIEERVLIDAAEARGISVEALLSEVQGPAADVSEAEIDDYLAEHPPARGDHAAARARVRDYLAERGKLERRVEFLRRLREEAGARILLSEPVPPRTELDVAGAPARGPTEAPIEIVHFSSLGSKVGARSAAKIERLRRAFPGQIRQVHRHLLNDRDELGLLAARIACAAEEVGRFWDFHDALVLAEADGTIREARPREQRLDPAAVTRAAQAIGLSPTEVTKASTNPKWLALVKRDIDAARVAGVPREPALFINGRFVSGIVAFEDLHEIVASEFERVRPGAAATVTVP